MEDRYDRIMRRLIKEEVRRINLHLPKYSKSLSELLEEKEPKVEAVDGSLIIMRRSELEELARAVPKEHHKQFKLPIVVIRRMSLGRGVFTLVGGKVECFAVKKILGLTSLSFDEMSQDEPCHLYRPQVQELLRKFKSLIIIGFGVPEELTVGL